MQVTEGKLSLKQLGVTALIATATLLALGAASYWAGRYVGTAVVKRLQLVWPDFLELPVKDRAVLTSLSMACELAAEPETREAVVLCLGRGLDRAKVPAGVSSMDEELMRLLELANPTTPDHEGRRG